MFFFLHPRKVTSNKEVALKVVQARTAHTAIPVDAPVLVVERALKAASRRTPSAAQPMPHAQPAPEMPPAAPSRPGSAE